MSEQKQYNPAETHFLLVTYDGSPMHIIESPVPMQERAWHDLRVSAVNRWQAIDDMDDAEKLRHVEQGELLAYADGEVGLILFRHPSFTSRPFYIGDVSPSEAE